MFALGAIVEFNPFHLGHKAHLIESKAISGLQKIVAVMSGNFVQRGEPAICDKWTRTKMALSEGVDIVIELPLPYVIGGADYFARGSVGLLAATGIVDVFSFGSECGDLTAIMRAGKVLAEEPMIYKEALHRALDSGASFAFARGTALACALDSVDLPEGLLDKPNNGLAIEYCKALYLLGSPMGVFTTHRVSGGVSATKTRAAFKAGEDVRAWLPESAYKMLIGSIGETASLDDFSDIFRYMVYRADSTLSEGLENRFRRFCGEHKSISDLLVAVKTKRYTFTRLQRTVLGIILGIDKMKLNFYEQYGGLQYIRVLGFRRESANLLSEMTKKASLPVMTNGAALDNILSQGGAAADMLAKELEAGDIYRLASGASGGFRSERAMGVVVV
ncbi:MAG: nucleotidyltransferase family protein [Defluviitaleaceae bacterium]|nr:nucleotidyltransferase family protein [Defluviitaleaceae bacterium]